MTQGGVSHSSWCVDLLAGRRVDWRINMDWSKAFSLAIYGLWVVAPIFAVAEDKASRESAPGSDVQLQALVREALERNPEIQAARRAAEARRARIPQARAWPDPTVSVSYGGNLLPPFTLMRGDPSSMRQFSAQQEIPYPGKTRLRGEIFLYDAATSGQSPRLKFLLTKRANTWCQLLWGRTIPVDGERSADEFQAS